MSKFSKTLFFFVITAVSLSLLINFAPTAADTQTVTVPVAPIPESADYATLTWGDPWDMSEYSDVSQYINESGNRDVVRNIGVNNGIFSATSVGSHETAQNGWFFTLFPGYETTIHAAQAGSMKPIESNQYDCLYIAMKTDSINDQYRIFWFGDDRLNTGGAPFGISNSKSLIPNVWNLYQIDLGAGTLYGTPWNDKATWQGLRIDPTVKGGTNFSVDWVRLTNCSAQTTNITFSPNNNITSVWLRPHGTSQKIRVATDVNGGSGSYDLDTQGFQPGTYHVGFGTTQDCCIIESAETLKINQTPIVHFNSPSFYSGQDYATTAGNAWDMDTSDDFDAVHCASYGLDSGKLWLNTPQNTEQPSECVGGPPQYVADPKIILNTPVSLDPTEYRYLTYRLYDSNPWQFVALGSISRWSWAVPGAGGSSINCYLVSQDIPFDVGWHTYTIDLWDTFGGLAEGWGGNCNNVSKQWKEAPEIVQFRFDPNENITDHAFYNEIDWIRLTKPIVIPSGTIFDLGLNKFFENDDFNIELFYTNDPQNQPLKHPVVVYTPAPPAPSDPPSGPFYTFLPLIVNGLKDPFLEADLEYGWDTTSVLAGEYFICARVDDSYNQAVFCSEASVTVTP